MILNQKTAIEGLLQDIEWFTLERIPILNLHATLADGLLRRSDDEGRMHLSAGDRGAQPIGA